MVLLNPIRGDRFIATQRLSNTLFARGGLTLALGAALSATGCGISLPEPQEPPQGVQLHTPPPTPVILRTDARSDAPQWAGTNRWTERETAVDAIGRIGGPEALVVLVDLLHGPDDKLCIGAARALAMMGPGATLAVPDLIGELSNPSAEVRKNVIRALGQVGAAAAPAIKPLAKEILGPESASDEEIERRRKPRALPVTPGAVPLPPVKVPASG